jgi:hypothetical protein
MSTTFFVELATIIFFGEQLSKNAAVVSNSNNFFI